MHLPCVDLLVGLFTLTSADAASRPPLQETAAVDSVTVKRTWCIEVFATDSGIDARIDCFTSDPRVHDAILVIDADGNWRAPRRADATPSAAAEVRRVLVAGRSPDR